MLYDPHHPAIFGYRGEFFFLSNFFSNMYPMYEQFKGTHIEYPTVEHAYQAAKTTRLQSRLNIARQSSAGRSKGAGRAVALRSDWEAIKDDVMRQWVREKFSQPDLRKRLLATYPAQLVEANNHNDQYWGTDMFGDGLNRLGEIQMEFRLELREHYGYPQG